MNYGLIVAGGTGSRMHSNTPKQFLPLLGKPVLLYSIDTFLKFDTSIQLIIVLAEEYMNTFEEIRTQYKLPDSISLTAGGNTRFHSVQNGLQLVNTDGIVFVHDAARPIIQTDLLEQCHTCAVANGSAIPCVSVVDSMRYIKLGNSKRVNRDEYCIVQTPQTFSVSLLKEAYKQEFSSDFTDDASVVETLGHKVHLVAGSRANIKITTPEDLIVAEALMKNTIQQTPPQNPSF